RGGAGRVQAADEDVLRRVGHVAAGPDRGIVPIAAHFRARLGGGLLAGRPPGRRHREKYRAPLGSHDAVPYLNSGSQDKPPFRGCRTAFEWSRAGGTGRYRAGGRILVIICSTGNKPETGLHAPKGPAGAKRSESGGVGFR